MHQTGAVIPGNVAVAVPEGEEISVLRPYSDEFGSFCQHDSIADRFLVLSISQRLDRPLVGDLPWARLDGNELRKDQLKCSQ
jgi:hypothetical protein